MKNWRCSSRKVLVENLTISGYFCYDVSYFCCAGRLWRQQTREHLKNSTFLDFFTCLHIWKTHHTKMTCASNCFGEEQEEKQKGSLLKSNYDSHYFPYKKPTVSSVTILILSDVLAELNTLPFLIDWPLKGDCYVSIYRYILMLTWGKYWRDCKNKGHKVIRRR